MKTYGLLGAISLGVALGGCGPVDDEPVRLAVSSCDDGRSTTFHVARDVSGAMNVISDGERGFLLFSRGSFGEGLVRVERDGTTLEQVPSPSGLASQILDVALLPDGSALLTGFTFQQRALRTTGWVAKVNTKFELEWELDLGQDHAQQVFVQALPDGGAIVAGTYFDTTAAEVSIEQDTDDAFWLRLSAEGDVVWEQRARFAGTAVDTHPWGARTLLMGAAGPRFVVQTEAGLMLLASDLDGTSPTHTLLQTRLALGLVGAVALPDGRLALASNRLSGVVITWVSDDGAVLEEKKYGELERARASGLAFDARRGELVMVGTSGNEGFRSWLLATDLGGASTWQLEREPLSLVPGHDGDFISAEPGRGPQLNGLAVAPDGSLLAAAMTQAQLSYFVVEPGGCR